MMEDKKGPSATASKVALSRALGAAFLNHQVEQLEKSVSNRPAVSGNWRDRRQTPPEFSNAAGRGGNNNSKRPMQPPVVRAARKKSNEPSERDRTESRHRRKLSGDPKVEKDADIVVVDASVLVHALYQVKKWCKEGREETVIVPLEALNTLDLLKKGTTSLAQRARAASRILEAQVGTNPRILVQRDDAFVLWDKIDFKDTDDVNGSANGGSPEWVRRTICCARWEAENAFKTNNAEDELQSNDNAQPKVVLAILSTSPQSSSLTSQPTAAATDTLLAPVPLPTHHSAKHEARSAGILVSHWAARAGIEMMEVAPTLPSAALPSASQNGKGLDEEERGKKLYPHARMMNSPRGRRSSHGLPSVSGVGGSALVERPPAVRAMMEMVSQPSKVVRVLARGEKLDPDP